MDSDSIKDESVITQGRRRRSLPFWQRQMDARKVKAALLKMGGGEETLEQFQKAYRLTRKNRWVANRELASEVERLRAELAAARGNSGTQGE